MIMLTHRFQNRDPEISALGLGMMRLPKTNPDKDAIDETKAQEIVDYAYANGVTYYDTAYMYHGGLSEEFAGRALKKYPRESFYLATKMPIWMAETPEQMAEIFENQLKKLQTDYFDFYLMHSLTAANFKKCEEFGLWEFLSEKKKQGIVRNVGFSFHDTPEVLKTIAAAHPWDFAQIQLNYLDWEMQDAKQQYEILEQHGIPCIVMEPVRGGALANPCEAANKLFREARPDRSVASWAIRYAASLPNVLTVLSGMSTMEQIQDNVATMNRFEPITPEDQAVIEKAVAAYKVKDVVPCTGCRYCMDCPQGVDIPKMFKLYNAYAVEKDGNAYLTALEKEPESEFPSSCISCGICASHCPQAIAIPEKLSEVGKVIVQLREKAAKK